MADSIHDTLMTIGFSDKEAKIYVLLLRYGTRSTSFLAQKANMNRGTTYVVLHALLKKGLTAKSTKGSVQYFSPLKPQSLLHYLDARQQQLTNQKEKVHAVMGQLIAITNPQTSQPKIEFFDGAEGAIAVLEETLTAKDSTLRAFLSIADINDRLGIEYFLEYTKRRVEKGYSLQVIRAQEKDDEAYAKGADVECYPTSVKEKREVAYVSKDLAFPLTMYMFDDKLAIISSKEENFALLIESHELAQMQKKLFTLVWSAARRTPLVS